MCAVTTFDDTVLTDMSTVMRHQLGEEPDAENEVGATTFELGRRSHIGQDSASVCRVRWGIYRLVAISAGCACKGGGRKKTKTETLGFILGDRRMQARREL